MTLQFAVPAPTRAAGRWRGTTLDRAFDPRRNSVNALRLVLAGIVLVSHTLKLHGGDDPVGRVTGSSVDMGTMAVDGFFALSGFLIAGSYRNSPSTARFLWRRCLRILPGFWVCLVVTAVVLLPIAQLLEFGTLAGFPVGSVASYVTVNAGLLVRQFEVAGLLGGEAVNGSLYTLFYEFACYLGIAAMGAAGLLRRRTWPLLAVAGSAWLLALSEVVTGAAITGESDVAGIALRFGTLFLAGAVAQRIADRVPLGPAGGVVAVLLVVQAVVVATLVGPGPGEMAYVVVAAPAVAYLVLLAGAHPLLHAVGAERDLSYGLYVYAWPVQILVLLAGAAAWPVLAYGLVSLGLALLLAWASWTWVEAPALRLRSWTPAFLR